MAHKPVWPAIERLKREQAHRDGKRRPVGEVIPNERDRFRDLTEAVVDLYGMTLDRTRQDERSGSDTREWASFGDFALGVRNIGIGQSDARLAKRSAGVNETVGSEGGFLVPGELVPQVLFRIYQQSIAGLCLSLPMARKTAQIPVVDETSRANGSRFGGVSSAWLDEGAALTPSKPKFGRLELSAKKLGSACWVTGELQQDVPMLGEFLTRIFTSEIATMLDAAILSGTGAGEPLGVLNSAALITASKEGGQAAATITAENLLDMHSRLWGPSRRSAVWFVNEETDTYLMRTFIPHKNVAGTENVGGTATYIPASSDDELPRLLGRPVYVCEQGKTLGQKGDIVLADPTQYQIATRELRLQSSIHSGFTSDETLYRFILRADGQPTWRAPVTQLNGSGTLSPYVTLEAR
jgi:HK97 family phage major capsid protein